MMGVCGTLRALKSSAANPGVYGRCFGINPRNARRYRAPTVQVPRTYGSMPVATTRVASNDIESAETLTPAGDVPSLDSLPYVAPLWSRSTPSLLRPYCVPIPLTFHSHPWLGFFRLLSVLNEQGALPTGEENAGVAVFAIYDKEQTIQYIGFSSNVAKSIEKLFYRRPAVTYYFKFAGIDSLDQTEMMRIRNSWFDSLGGPPIGNKNLAEKEAWQVPVQVSGNSEGGTLVAAGEAAAMMVTQIKNRGCTVDFAPEPALLQKGIIEFVTLTPEEIERIRVEKEKLAESIKQFTFINEEGEEEEFELLLNSELKTNGGYMYDVTLMHDGRETNHRVIVGKKYYKHGTFEPEAALGATFGYILKREIPRQTEGILSQTQFSANYFSVAEVHQCFADFEDDIPMQIDGDSFWKFRRLEKYGYAAQENDAELLNMQFNRDN